MFEWKAEEGKLLKEPIRTWGEFKGTFELEHSVSREDKIEFIDRMTDGNMSYLINLYEKYKADEKSLPKEKYGGVKTVSLVAWLKRNDPKGECTRTSYGLGEINVLGRQLRNFEHKTAYSIYDNGVDEYFHKILQKCLVEEKQYVRSHDEYFIACEKLQKGLNTGRYDTFGTSVIFGTDGLYIAGKVNSDERRRMTLDELNYLLDLNGQVEEFREMLRKENKVRIDKPMGKEPDLKKIKDFYER